jgi:hypothetical protein
MADIPMLQTATVGSATGFLFPSEKKKRPVKRRGKLWLLLSAGLRTVRMESKDLAGPEQHRTSNASAVERIKVGRF